MAVRGGERPKSRRTVKLHSEVVAALVQHRVKQSELRAAAGGRWTEHDLIFTTLTGGPLDERNLAQQDFVRILKTSGLPDFVRILKTSGLPATFRLYDLRHTAATLALAAGVPPKIVSEMLGHASAAFTLDVYSHVLRHMQDSAVEKVEHLSRRGKRK